MSRPGKWVLAALFVLITLAGIGAARRFQLVERLSASSNNNAALAQLFAVPMMTSQGERKSISEWKGKVLIVNFWATWCPPCRDEMPEFSRAQDKYGPDGVQFLGVAIDDATNVAEFARTTPVNYPLLVSPTAMSELTAKLGNRHQVLPFTLIIGRDGKQFSSHIGRLSEEDLKTQIAPLL